MHFSCGKSPYTFGELLQGRNSAKEHFLVTLPIDRFSTAWFTELDGSPRSYVYPTTKTKSLRAMEIYLEIKGIVSKGLLILKSPSSEGKGFASSSADIVATIRALDVHFGEATNHEGICDIMRKIEPSDAVMYNEAVQFCHVECRVKEVIGRLPPMAILCVDEGGSVDTVEFNKTKTEFTEKEHSAYDELVAELKQAVLERSAKGVAHVATQSTQMAQRRLPKEGLSKVLALAERVGADGVVNSHSGTVLGLCFGMNGAASFQRVNEARSTLSSYFRGPIEIFYTL